MPGLITRLPSFWFRGPAALFGLAVALILFGTGCFRRETLVQRGNVEKVLHRSVGHELTDLDPHLATQTSDYHVLSALFEGLVSEDPIDLHPVPGVAESWDLSPDALVYTFHLRSNARWSNGETVTAVDFLLSFKRMLSPSLAAENAVQLYILKGAEEFHQGKSSDFSTVGVEAPDERTLKLTLRHPSATFLSKLNDEPWFPVHIPTIAKYGPVAKRGTPWTRPGALVGNGPFNLKEWSINHRIVVTRSSTYWDRDKVRLKEIHFYPYDPDTEERAFRAGQLHLTDALPPQKIERYRKTAPELLKVEPLLATYFYRINNRLPSLSDARVRLALSLALDRKAIVDRVLQGSQIAASAFTPAGITGYEPPALVRFDPQAARSLLTEAGYTGGKGLPPVELLYNSSELHRQIAEAVQEMWRQELGITVRLLNMENTSVLAARRSGDFQLVRSSWTGDFIDPENFLEIWTAGSGNNFTGWTSKDYDQLLETAAGTIDPVKRFALMRSAERLLLEQSPCIPIYHFAHIYLRHPAVQGWYPTLLDHHPYKYVWLKD